MPKITPKIMPKIMPIPATLSERKQRLLALAENLQEPSFSRVLVDAYVQDTAFVRKDVIAREVWTPATLLALLAHDSGEKGPRLPLGKVGVLVPKNSLGLTLAKAIAGSFLMGNETLVRMPRQLEHTLPIYEKLVTAHLPGVTFAAAGMTGQEFLSGCLRDPLVDAVVIYGDDAWIDGYWPEAKHGGTKLLFEGPGNDALIVMPDADLPASVEGAIRGGLNNGGQSCSAFERFFVHRNVAREFTALLVERLATLRLGDPASETTDVGPIASSLVARRIEAQIADALAKGARLELGGVFDRCAVRDLPRLAPTVLTGCTPDMTAVSDETFGPLFPVLEFSSLDSLLPPLDATRYGLNAAVYGTCPARLRGYLESHHRNTYLDATPADRETIASRLVDGGYRRSGFVWEARDDGAYVAWHGRRFLADELSVPAERSREPGVIRARPRTFSFPQTIAQAGGQ